jgi:sulfur-oxidizing protein SoxX
MRKTSIIIVTMVLAGATAALAQQKPAIDPARVDAAVKAAFPTAPADWAPRLTSDETMKQCSAHENSPPKAIAAAIRKREKATIEYPSDGKFLGDWKNGEKFAQSGYGLRFTDYPPRNVNGGNCYACHQLTKQEVSYGTVGPSLLGYGAPSNRNKGRVRNLQFAHFPCSFMPRFAPASANDRADRDCRPLKRTAGE